MIYAFGSMALDLAKMELRDSGQVRPVEPQVFALVAYLAEHRDRVVSRNEIFEKLWEGRVVSDSALASRIKSARQALGDDGRRQAIIRTIHGRGLRFVAEVSVRHDRSVALQTVDELPPAAGAETMPGGMLRPSIAVLPFRTIGDAGDYATIADGLPHELITELARLRWLFVVARGTSFRLRDANLDPRDIRGLLGVRYCLSGTVEIAGQRLVVTAELIDTRGGEIVWGERYAGQVTDVHSMRDDIRTSILGSLEIQIPLHEASAARLTAPDNLDAWSAYHLGLQHLYRFNRSDNLTAADLFGRAINRDPGFARAHAGLSFVHFQTAFLRQSDNIDGAVRLAREYAQRGVDLDPLDPFVNFTMGRTYWLNGDLNRALSWLERSTSLCPNFAQGFYARAWTEIMAGSAVDARDHLDLALRLSPLDPLSYAMLSARGLTCIAQGDDRAAADWTERGAQAPGAHALIAMIAAAAQVLAGNDERARSWAADVRARAPHLGREDFFRAFPMKSETMRQRLAGALRSLGF